MTFLSPEWMFLLPGLIAMAWIKPELKLHTPLRALLLLLLVFALSRPVISSGGSGRDIWLLVDQSASVNGMADNSIPEVESILSRGQSRHDNIYVVDFGRDSVIRGRGDPTFTGGTGETRLGSTIESVLAQSDSARDTRFIVLTDGYSTEPLDEAGEKLLKSGVRLDYRLVGANMQNDTRVADLRTPSRVLPGQAFLIEFSVRGTNPKPVRWELRQGESVVSGTADLRSGQAHVRLTDRLMSAGSARYEITIFPEDDMVAQNNRAQSYVEVAGGSDVLLVTAYENDPLAGLIQAQGLKVRMVTKPEILGVHDLSGSRLVLLNNVPATSLSKAFLGGLPFFVREQAGGLAMVGGKTSFNSGGYFSTPVEDLLPVSMELKKDQRNLVTAISFVLDRSGSMSVTTSSGATKMDLANRGTVEAIKMMFPQDYVSVHAVDSLPHKIVGLTKVGENSNPLTNVVRKIQSMGGGIFVYEGLKAGWEELKKAPMGTKHMVLFSDASDSEEPGDYSILIAEMVETGTSVSVIALGSSTDCDADLLRDIAQQGNGRIYFSESGVDLPAIFSQETALVARSAFITEPTPVVSQPGWFQISSNSLAWPETVDAYNLCYLREGAISAVMTKDEYEAPLVAFWSRGAGRVAAITFPMGGKYSDTVRAWPQYGDFTHTLSRWLIGSAEPEGYSLRTNLNGDTLVMELLYGDQRVTDIAKTPPVARIEIQEGEERKIENTVWEKIEPGRFISTLRLTPNSLVRGVVAIGDSYLPFGPISLPSDLEWSMDHQKVQELKQLSTLSGGGEVIDFSSIWNDPLKKTELPLLPYLLLAALLLFLLDAFLTRYGLLLTFKGWEKK